MNYRLGAFSTDQYAVEEATSRLNSAVLQDKVNQKQSLLQQKKENLAGTGFATNLSDAPEEEESTLAAVGREIVETPSAIAAGVAKGATDLFAGVGELVTLPFQEIARAVTGDETIDYNFINQDTKDSIVAATDKLVGYDREADEASMQRAMDEFKAAGVDVTSWDSIKEGFTDENKQAKLSAGAKELLSNPSYLLGMLGEIGGAGGALSLGGKAVMGAAKLGEKALTKTDDATDAYRAATAGEAASRADVVYKDGIPQVLIEKKFTDTLTDALSTSSTKMATAENAVMKSTMSEADKLSKVKEIQDQYTITDKMMDLVKGNSTMNAAWITSADRDIAEAMENNKSEANPTGELSEEAKLGITLVRKFTSVLEGLSFKAVTGLPKEMADEIVEKAIPKAAALAVVDFVAAGTIEGGQEVIDALVEQYTQKFNTEKYKGKSYLEVVREASPEIIASLVAGSGSGMYAKGLALGAQAAIDTMPEAIEKYSEMVNSLSNTGIIDNYKEGKTSATSTAAETASATPSDKDTYMGILKEVTTDYDNGLVTYDNLGDYVTRLETMQELRPTLAGVYQDNPALVEAIDQRYKVLATNINNMITSPNAKDSDLRLTRRLALDLPTPEAATLGSQGSEVTFKQQEYTDADRKADAERLLHFVIGEQDVVTPELASKYSRFATANGVELERLNTIIKSYESVEDEASVGRRGWKTYETKIDALMGSSNPDKAALTRQYRNLNNWLMTTLNSKAGLEDGINQAQARAEYLNKTPVTLDKAQSIVTSYMKADNKPFDIMVKKVGGKWVADTAAAEKLIALKDHNIEEIKAVINKYNSRASQLITDINNVGNVIVPPAGSSDRDSVAKGRKADSTFYSNQVAKLNNALGVARGVNKVLLDKEARNDAKGTKQATYSKKWAVNNPYHRVNGALINTGNYNEGDVVLLNAMGTFKLSNTKKVISSLYAKNSEARQEINKVIAARASIVLDREYIANKSTYFTKDGKKYVSEVKGQLNQAGKKVEEFLESQGYVRLPGTSAVFVHEESNKDKVAEAKKKVDETKAAKSALTRAKNQLVDLQVKLDYAKERNLDADVILELEQEIAQLKIDVLPAFGEESLAEVSSAAEETGTEVEQVDTDIGTVSDNDVDGTVRTEEQLEEAEETDTALVAEAKVVGRDRSQKLDSYISRRIREKLVAVDNSTVSAEAVYDSETGEWNKKAVDIILAAKKSTLDEVQEEADAAVNTLLGAWGDLVKEGLRGEELANKVKELVDTFDPRLKNVYGDVSYISKSLLDSALGANRPDMYEVSVRIVDNNGPRLHVQPFMSEEAAKKFIADTKKKYPTVTTKDDKGNVRDTIPFVEGKKVIVLSAPTKVVLDPNKIVAAATDKSTLLNTLPVEMLPGKLKAEIGKFKEYAKKRIKTISETEKKDSEAIKQVDKDSKDDSSKFYLLNDPARGLMLNKNGDMSPQVAAAMYLAVGEAFVTDRMKLMLGHKDDETVARMFGVHESAVTSQMREHAGKHGMLRKTMANALGKDILKQLGYVNKKDKDTGIGHYEALSATLGNMAIEAAIEAGLLQGTQEYSSKLADMYGEGIKENANDFTGNELTYYVNIASTKKTVGKFERHEITGSVDKFIGNYEKETEKLPGVKTRETGPVFTALTSDEIEGQLTNVRNDITGAHKIPEKAKKTLRHMMNTRYVLDVNRAKALLEVVEDEVAGAALKASLGYIEIDSDEYNNLAYKQKEVQPAINMGIDKSFEHIRSLVEKAGSEEELSMWFKHYYSSNGRFMIDSNTVNPQTDKLMRFLVQPASHKVTHTVGKSTKEGVTFKVGNVDTSYYVRIALAQAFGVGIDKEKPLDTVKYGNVLLSLDEKQLLSLREAMLTKGKAEINYTNGAVSSKLEVEAEHLTHTLQGIDFLLDVQKGGDVTSSLTAEFDALTSGFANKTQQFPVLEDMKDHWERVGILTPRIIDNYNMMDGDVFVGSISSVLSKNAEPNDKSTFLDSYQNLAVGTGKASEEKFASIASGSDRMIKDSPEAASGIKALAAAMEKHLPRAEEGKVSKDLRTLFKNPFMIFNYSAGIKTIVKNLSHDVVEEMLHKVAKDDPKGQAIGKALLAGGLAVDMGNNKFSKELKDLVKVLRYEPITSNKLVVLQGGKRIQGGAYALMNKIVNATFGSSVEKTFKEKFGKYIEIQSYTNDAFKISFARFEFSFNEQYKKLLDGKGFATEEEVQGIIKGLWNEFPWIKGPLSELENNFDAIPVVDMDTRDPGIMSGRRTPQSVTEGEGGKAKYVTVHPIIKRLKAATSAGSVLPFHYIDGAQLGEMINEINEGANEEAVGVLPVHDAVTMPIHMMDEIAYTFNKVWYKTGKNYSLIDAIVEMVDRWNTSVSLESYQVKGLKVFQDEEKVAKGKNIRVDKSIGRAQTLVTKALKDLQKEINDAREKYYTEAETAGKEFGYNNVVGTVGSTYFPRKEMSKAYLDKFATTYLGYVTEVEGVEKKTFEDIQAEAATEDAKANATKISTKTVLKCF